ncbi:hypothetical protein Tco_1280189 [Tanacetum coccineum]
MDEDELVSIILGRPFLATARATEEEEEEDSNKVLVVSFYPRIEPVEPLEWKALENRLKLSSVEPPKLELKEFPEHLEYDFLKENNQLLVVISSALSTVEKGRLLDVLRNHKGAIAWSIAEIKGIDSSFYTHKILIEDEFKPSVQPQRRVNPNIKEVVKKEVIKLLDAGLIYLISDSPWVSPVQSSHRQISSILGLIQDHRLHGLFCPAVSLHKTRCKTMVNSMDPATPRIRIWRSLCIKKGAEKSKGAENLAVDHLS